MKLRGKKAKPKDGCGKALSQPLLIQDECDTARKHAWSQILE